MTTNLKWTISINLYKLTSLLSASQLTTSLIWGWATREALPWDKSSNLGHFLIFPPPDILPASVCYKGWTISSLVHWIPCPLPENGISGRVMSAHPCYVLDVRREMQSQGKNLWQIMCLLINQSAGKTRADRQSEGKEREVPEFLTFHTPCRSHEAHWLQFWEIPLTPHSTILLT